MKIGILTYHRSHNYGALLQSIATRVVLEGMGHEVYYVDYWPGYHHRKYARINYKRVFNPHLRGVVRYVRDVLWAWDCKTRRINNMKAFIKEYIKPYCKSLDDHYDVIVYGSDQIWRKQPEGVGYNPMYFGKNKLACRRHVSYAASMGVLPNNKHDMDTVRELVSNIDRISVRELDLRDFLMGMGFKDISVCLDPTLLLTSSQWDDVF